MPDKTPPYEIGPDAARAGDLLELTGYPIDPEMRITGRARDVMGSLKIGAHTVQRAIKITLLDRPEPPKPPLPTEPLTAIRCTIDAEATAVLALDGRGWWAGSDHKVSRAVGPHDLDRITDWTVVYDPTAPKADEPTDECTCVMTEASQRRCPEHGEDSYRTDDGLRERMQVLAGAFEASGNASGFDSATAAWHLAARKLRDALTETSAS